MIDWWHLLSHAGVVVTVVAPLSAGGWKVYRALMEIKLNHLHHLDEKITRIDRTTQGISDRLDSHLEWHAEHPIPPA